MDITKKRTRDTEEVSIKDCTMCTIKENNESKEINNLEADELLKQEGTVRLIRSPKTNG